MKKLFLIPVLFLFFLFASCVQVVETVVTLLSDDFSARCKQVSEYEYFKNDPQGKKSCDWLFIMYMDADNSLESSIRTDFNEVEKGLASIRNANGDAASGYASVRVVVLWDGLQSKDSKIFEVYPDTTDYYAGQNTCSITGVDFISSSGNEVDMSQGSTLTSFLKFVDKHYNPRIGKILHVADHGSGPGEQKRAMCEDKTPYTGSLTAAVPMSSSEFSTALYNAGYGFAKETFSILLLDVCLGASFEDAYQFRNCAEYLIASPNSTPASGFNYTDIMKCFVTGMNSRLLSYTVAKTFQSYYEGLDAYGKDPTVTAIDLSKMDGCAEKINALASELKDKKTTYFKYLKYDGNLSDYESWNYYMVYKGSVNWLFDIGCFADKVYLDPESTQEIKDKATAVNQSLSSSIVYNWRRNVYSFDTASNKCLGITICGGMVGSNKTTMGIPSWYKPSDGVSSLAFCNLENGWADMVKEWFGVGTGVIN